MDDETSRRWSCSCASAIRSFLPLSHSRLALPFPPEADLTAIDSAVDRVRTRFGNAAVMRGVLLGRDPGLEMPMLAD